MTTFSQARRLGLTHRHSDNQNCGGGSLAQACKIETLDRSGRWYLTPGAKSIYDLRVRNDSNAPFDCSLVLEEPASGAVVEPPQFTLRGHEVRTVTVTFAPDAPPARTSRVCLALRSADGSELARFEQPVAITGGSDCSISLAWKDAIVESGDLRGFELACSVRSQSEGPTSFPLTFASHPALSFPNLPPLVLEPGQSVEVAIPVRWNRDVKDESGANHPALLEVGVPVSNGRRTSRMRWDAIESQLQPFKWNDLLATVHAPGSNGSTNGVATKDRADDAAPTAQKEPAPATEPTKEATAAVLALPPATAPATEPATGAAPAQTTPSEPAVPAGIDANAATASAAATPSPDLPLFNGVAPDQAHFEQPQEAVTAPPDPKAVAELAAAAAAFTASLAPSNADPGTAALENAITTRRDAAVSYRSVRESPQVRKIPAGWIIAALAAIAIAVAAIFVRPAGVQQAPSTGPVTITTPVAVTTTQAPSLHVPAAAIRPPARHHASAKPTPRAQPQPTPTAGAATPQPTTAATAAPVTRTPPSQPRIALQPVNQPAAQRPAFRRARVAAAPVGPVVALGGIEAHYGARGHAVRVNWSAAEQSSANVQLIDDRGTTLNAITVGGYRRSVLLYLPPGYRGPVTIQLTSVGRLGERVAQTASLPPF